MEQYLDQLREIEHKFYDYQQNLDAVIRTVSSAIQHTVISKGELSNPTPYDHERRGGKPNGKILRVPVLSDWCMKYHYDRDNRLILIEEYSVSLEKFRITSIFRYGERTERLYLSSERLVRLSVFDHGFSNTNLCLSFAGSNGYIAEEYIYEGTMLQEIRILRVEHGPEIHKCVYEREKLAQIVRICPNGYREILYTTKKPDFSRICEKISGKIRMLIAEQEGSFDAFGIEAFLDQQQPMLCVCFAEGEQPEELIADWNGEMYPVRVYDWQLNDAQEKKCAKMIAELLVRLTEEGLLRDKQIYFHQNQICATLRYSGVKSVFRKAGLIVR